MKNDKCNACSGFPTGGVPCEPNKFTQAVVEINNPKECPILFHKVVIPVTMGDETAVPPEIGKYSNVLLVYEINNHSYLYSSDGVPTRLNNGITNYEESTNLPQINGVTLIGNKTSEDLHITGSSLKIAVDWTTQTWSGADSVEDIYDYFANKGKVVFFDSADDGGEYSYEIIFMGYVPNEHKILGIIQFGNVVNDGEGHQEFDGTFAYGMIELYNQDRGVYAGSMEVQRALSVVPNTGLDFNYSDTLSGVPATENSLGMIKVGPGLDITENGVLTVTEDIKGFDTVADMKSADNLVDGSFVETYGFYAKGDGGGAKYKIRAKVDADVLDEMFLFALSDDSLVAEYVIKEETYIKTLGIKGDGVTDVTSLFGDAVSKCSAKGVKTLRVNKGTYIITSQITIPDGFNLIGEGYSDTILYQPNTTVPDTNTYILRINGGKNITIEGICLKGAYPSDDYTTTPNKVYLGIYLYGAEYITIKNCKLCDIYTSAISVRETSNVAIVNNVFAHNGWNDVALTKTTKNIEVTGNDFADVALRGVNAEDGTFDEPCDNIRIVNNHFNTTQTSSTTTRAFSFAHSALSGNNYRYTNIIIDGNTVENIFEILVFGFTKNLVVSNNAFSGARVTTASTNMTGYNSNITFTDNIISLAHGSAYQKFVGFSKVEDLIFNNNSIYNSTSAGLSIDTSTRCNIANNIIKDSTSNGIILSGCTFVKVIGNTVRNTTSSSMYVNGSNCEISENRFESSSNNGINFQGTLGFLIVNNNYFRNITGYAIKFSSAGDMKAVVSYNYFEETTESTPMFTYALYASASVDYVVIENNYLMTSGITLNNGSNWGANCQIRNNKGFTA